MTDPVKVSRDLYSLACGADQNVHSFSGCIMNGIRFHTKQAEQYRRTQNSGVVVEGWHNSEIVDFYGVVKDILEIHYLGGRNVYIFNCDWWDMRHKTKGAKIDGHFTCVNTSYKWYEDDPFILATQAKQVFYLNDTKLRGSWRVVQKITTRNLYDAPPSSFIEEDVGNYDAYQEAEPTNLNGQIVEEGDEPIIELHRDDVLPEHVEIHSLVETEEAGEEEIMFIDDDSSNENDDDDDLSPSEEELSDEQCNSDSD